MLFRAQILVAIRHVYPDHCLKYNYVLKCCSENFLPEKVMPKGLPSAEALMARCVTFFSIETEVIQALGYKFSEGALHALALQRPSWVEIRLTEIVEREVMAHRTEPVGKAITELLSALANTQRLTSTDLHAIKEQVDAMHLAVPTSTDLKSKLSTSTGAAAWAIPNRLPSRRHCQIPRPGQKMASPAQPVRENT